MNYVFTTHVVSRMVKRRLAREEVIEAIRTPEETTKKYGKYYARKNIGRGAIEVVYERTEKYIRVITVYWA